MTEITFLRYQPKGSVFIKINSPAGGSNYLCITETFMRFIQEVDPVKTGEAIYRINDYGNIVYFESKME